MYCKSNNRGPASLIQISEGLTIFEVVAFALKEHLRVRRGGGEEKQNGDGLVRARLMGFQTKWHRDTAYNQAVIQSGFEKVF